MANYEISNIQMRVFNHISNFEEELLSTRISFNLQESRAPVNIVESITTILQNSESLNLNGGFQILAFQPSCKYNINSNNTYMYVFSIMRISIAYCLWLQCTMAALIVWC